MKQGLFQENGSLVYYKDDMPRHAGVVKIDGAIYYIGSGGHAVKGKHVVHKSMANDILQRGTYTFGEDYKLIPDSFIPAKKIKNKRIKRPKQRRKHRSSGRIRRLLRHSIFKSKKTIAITVSAIVLLTGLVVGAAYSDKVFHKTEIGEPAKPAAASKVVLPVFDEEVLLCSQDAKDVYDHKIAIEDSLVTNANSYRAFVFEYDLVDMDGVLLLGESEDLSDARSYELSKDRNKVTIDNLKTGTTYYYRVIADGEEYNGSFRTAESTRFVYMEGVGNTRDIGGYTTLDGKKVRQGLLIRGRELDGLVQPTAGYILASSAVDDVQKDFGFVYDLDLREAGIYAGDYHSYLGEDVGHRFYTSPQYGQIFQPVWQDSLRQIFADLADPDKYPMYLHCTYGADRTGTIVFLLQGILNMPEEDMLREYRMTGFLSENTSMDAVILGMRPYEGDTLGEKIVTWLTTVVGVTDEQIESIRDIFLED